jgi:hypothetical protein
VSILLVEVSGVVKEAYRHIWSMPGLVRVLYSLSALRLQEEVAIGLLTSPMARHGE